VGSHDDLKSLLINWNFVICKNSVQNKYLTKMLFMESLCILFMYTFIIYNNMCYIFVQIRFLRIFTWSETELMTLLRCQINNHCLLSSKVMALCVRLFFFFIIIWFSWNRDYYKNCFAEAKLGDKSPTVLVRSKNKKYSYLDENCYCR